ncbi:MAG: DNA polymerase V subunit UmuD [SAR86 cluster bacterium BACL1 MAG-121105-bin34]|jgi:DNA polymerase V|uniref:DNA polymerase V subunit UmuD n=1 Tax=SAR86 cluster bacterium BACL1 MAG-120820-bin45 TaxID=1655612 RepID=A0A0R2UDW7_9GAMM|nr:MAG: DNA polymerase V subunit UmuD [SAR86 cluster bacterium BACL1 MAG-120507-bin14]KRO95408.1 MAG: DNA polymerase V subunit UmuD [SAR86 cluster bacterium BACL1 MAG-120820-bin45]KRO97571.1 MAG: DNA polymerase V subunit UmuD [SAR86 cluster bacterium BACL1 MAG-120828-bin5]KRO99075.1 MAG: DNA polymerase V subunit UmuD [SAR86 cluster bacterium BACL1 MAG-120823-bin87]KRP00481.1 MAG: DNA polymerase V subunit UmuD [SAR86 cluster bacterium BACL1 MAG-120813-bin36]KRP03459.1 MAG: DNA polymerase V subu
MTINYLGSISVDDLPATFTKFFLEPVSVGFPSPANDYLESPIDLNKYLIKNNVATFLIRVSGESMINANIGDQAILIVDRSLKPRHGSIVVASLDGEFVCKRLQLKPRLCLLPENPAYKPIYVQHGQDLDIMGTVTAAINKFE